MVRSVGEAAVFAHGHSVEALERHKPSPDPGTHRAAEFLFFRKDIRNYKEEPSATHVERFILRIFFFFWISDDFIARIYHIFLYFLVWIYEGRVCDLCREFCLLTVLRYIEE